MTAPTSPRGYCSSCNYRLHGQTPANSDSNSPQYRCPECGRPFDPASPKTYRLHPHRPLTRWLAKPSGWFPAMLLLLGAVGVVSVSRWDPATFKPSAVDLIYYFRPSALFHHTRIQTTRDLVFTVSICLTVAAAVWICMRWILGMIARSQMGMANEPPPAHLGRRRVLVFLGLAVTSAAAALGWPYRLAQQWIATRIAKGKIPVRVWTPGPLAPPPTNLSPDQLLATLRAAVIEMPEPKQRMTGLQLLVEDNAASALPILSEAVSVESDSEVRALELRLIGIHRQAGSVPLVQGFLTHPDPETRAAAADALGLIHEPAFAIPLSNNVMGYTASLTVSSTPVNLQKLVTLHRDKSQNWPESLDLNVIPVEHDIRVLLENLMLTGTTLKEREAAARALRPWPPDDSRLRVAEWGVWINDNGQLKLIQSVIDEIPPFVHRAGNPLNDFKDRVNQIFIITKPIIHITVDRPLVVDIGVLITEGRPWFVFPRSDDFVADVQTVYTGWQTPPVPLLLSPLENPVLDKLSDLRQGYPWLTPSHVVSGPISSLPGGDNEVTSLGLRWQSLIVTPTRLPWMTPPEVGNDPRFAWWSRLREVPSSWLSSRGESERFLYYDGPTLAPAPVNATLNGNQLHLSLRKESTFTRGQANFPPLASAEIPQSILLIHLRAGKVSAQSIPPPADWNPAHPEIACTLSDDNLQDADVRTELHRMLTHAGLTSAEADGLIAAWEPQFFQTDGTRLLVIMSRHDYDVLCPINILPNPTELARVGIILTEFPPAHSLTNSPSNLQHP